MDYHYDTDVGTSSMCGDGEVQLIGGDSEMEGQVEMCYSGAWGAVCADGWNETAANIVCTQLGYENHGKLIIVSLLSIQCS